MLLTPFLWIFVNLIKKSLTICLWSADQKRFVYSLTPSHMCEGVFLVVATRFELATSASRTQRSTKLSHATM